MPMGLLFVGYHLQGIEVLLHHAHQVVGIGGDSHGLVEALQRPFHLLAVGLLAYQYAYRGIVLRVFDELVNSRHVETQLTNVLGLEGLDLQFEISGACAICRTTCATFILVSFSAGCNCRTARLCRLP